MSEKKKLTVALVAAGLLCAATAQAWVTNQGGRPTGSQCTDSSGAPITAMLARRTYVLAADKACGLPGDPWNYSVDGNVTVGNAGAVPAQVVIEAVYGSDSCPACYSTILFAGSVAPSELRIVPYLFLQAGLPAGQCANFAVRAHAMRPATCVQSSWSTEEHD